MTVVPDPDEWGSLGGVCCCCGVCIFFFFFLRRGVILPKAKSLTRSCNDLRVFLGNSPFIFNCDRSCWSIPLMDWVCKSDSTKIWSIASKRSGKGGRLSAVAVLWFSAYGGRWVFCPTTLLLLVLMAADGCFCTDEPSSISRVSLCKSFCSLSRFFFVFEGFLGAGAFLFGPFVVDGCGRGVDGSLSIFLRHLS